MPHVTNQDTRIGVLIIGSLFWREESGRESWRRTRLRVDQAIQVEAPIRYLRKSKSKSFTMVFALAAKGTALVVPCQPGPLNAKRLEAEAESLWAAEKNAAVVKDTIAEPWGCVCALFRDKENSGELRAAWANFFTRSKAVPVGPVNSDGLLEVPWPERVDGLPLDFDVLLATSTRPTGAPTAEEIADAWLQNAGTEEYFFKNVRHAIRTPDDAEIWRRMEQKPEWLKGVAEKFLDPVTKLRAEANRFGAGVGYVPNHPRTPTYVASCKAMVGGDLVGAINMFLAEPESSPCRGLALSLAAQAAAQLNRYDDAIRDGHAAIQHFGAHGCPFNPLGVAAYRCVANALAKSDRVMQAIEVYQVGLGVADKILADEASSDGPEERGLVEVEMANVLTDFGGSLLRLQQPKAAAVQLQAARKIYAKYPKSAAGRPVALTNLAMAYHLDGKGFEADQALLEALSIPQRTAEENLETRLLQVRFGLLDASTSEQTIEEGVATAIATGRYETACARLASAIARASEAKDNARVLQLFERVAEVEPKLPPGNLIPVKLSFYHALAKRQNGRPRADYLHHLTQGAREWCSLQPGRLTLADYQQLALTMHDHFRLFARVLVEEQRIEESLVAFEMGRARAYAAELSQDARHPLLSANPFHAATVGLELLRDLQQKLPADAVLVCIGTMPPDLCAYVIGRDSVELRSVPIVTDVVQSLADLPANLRSNMGEKAVHASLLELAKVIAQAVGAKKIVGFVPHRDFHAAPWRAILRFAGLPWSQLPFAVNFSPFLWQTSQPLPAKCIAIGHGVAGDKSEVDLRQEAVDFSQIFGADGMLRVAALPHLKDALASDGIVLLSCHGILMKTEFGPKVLFKLSDGDYELSEALDNRRTPTPLVVLSACDSGAYVMLEGDYPVGAAPALLLAGAAHCACTRFPVDAFFARDFVCAYGRLLRRGDPPVAAFADALAEMEHQKYGLWRHLACVELLSRGG